MDKVELSLVKSANGTTKTVEEISEMKCTKAVLSQSMLLNESNLYCDIKSSRPDQSHHHPRLLYSPIEPLP